MHETFVHRSLILKSEHVLIHNLFYEKYKHFCTGSRREGGKQFHSSTAVIMFKNTMDFFVLCTFNFIQYTLVDIMDKWG